MATSTFIQISPELVAIISALIWVGFFGLQALRWGERSLTIAAIVLSALTMAIGYHENEWRLFAVGLSLGIFVEVVLGLVIRQQHWTNASLFGVPYWLPIVWGIAFVAMRRIGNVVVA